MRHSDFWQSYPNPDEPESNKKKAREPGGVKREAIRKEPDEDTEECPFPES
jgi:hypothetical protein